MMKASKLGLVCLLLSLGMIGFTGCRKKKDTIAKVYVSNALGGRIISAYVVLKGVSTTSKTSSFSDTALTNTDGEAIFNLNELYKLGQAGVAVLDIISWKTGTPANVGVIQVEQETTSEAHVII
ncbi:MAG: hypothetical protein EP338_12865 [Bacteroidetes bacterium]|nr:MAG: hypothetical protein EP338_12865 [Bacteroidota bacterium]